MYHYTSCGLKNIWLKNGYETKHTAYGKAVAIRDLEGLHRAIARTIIASRPKLSGAEFRFLRKELELSQASIAKLFGNDAQSVALWEKRSKVPTWADRLLRGLYRATIEGNVPLRRMIEELNALERWAPGRLTFEDTRKGWARRLAA
jgi:DNA-binding transcriptional regulator YiaG